MVMSTLKSRDIQKMVRTLGELRALNERVTLGDPLIGKIGICGWVSSTLCLRDHFESWLHYSGSRTFPIAGDYSAAHFAGALWSANTEYGRLRRDLLTHCIKSISFQLHSWYTLLRCLEDVALHGPASPNRGICGQPSLIDAALPVYARFQLGKVFAGWPLYSGSVAYPVPSVVEGLDAQDCYHTLPKWEGVYGDLRRDLLAYTIDTLRTGLRGYTNIIEVGAT